MDKCDDNIFKLWFQDYFTALQALESAQFSQRIEEKHDYTITFYPDLVNRVRR